MGRPPHSKASEMSINTIFICLLALGAFSYFFGRHRIRAIASGASEKQHSRDVYHGSFLVICTTLVPLTLLIVWSGVSPLVIDALLEDFLTARMDNASIGEIGVAIAKVKAFYAAPSMKPLSMILRAQRPPIMPICCKARRRGVLWRCFSLPLSVLAWGSESWRHALRPAMRSSMCRNISCLLPRRSPF